MNIAVWIAIAVAIVCAIYASSKSKKQDAIFDVINMKQCNNCNKDFDIAEESCPV